MKRIKFRIAKSITALGEVRYYIQCKNPGFFSKWETIVRGFDSLDEIQKRIWDLKRTDVDVEKINRTFYP